MTRFSRSTLALTTGALAAALSLTACESSGRDGDPRIIEYAHVQEPPCIFGGWIQQAYISRQVLDRLVTLADDQTIQPWLAESWEVSPDGRTYTFKLKKGVEFTDGTPVNAEAVAYNFDQFRDTDINSTAKVSLAPYYDRSEAVDDTTVAIHLTDPYPEFLRLITQGYFGIQSQTALKTRSKEENCEKPIGSGAFTVDEWQKGQKVVFKRNPDYNSWPATAKNKGPALVEQVNWNFVPDATARYASLTTGQTDAVYEVPTVQWKDAQSRFDNTIRYITPGKPVSFYINTEQGPFSDKLVRQAFAHAADRRAAVEAGFHGVIPYEPNPAVSQSTPGYVADDPYPHDPAKSSALLRQAGWAKGADGIYTKGGERLAIRLVYGAGFIFTSEGATVLQALQEQWKGAGFDIDLIPSTMAELWGGKYDDPATYDAIPSYWTSPSPAILWIVWRASTPDDPNGNNRSHYDDARLTRLIDAANTDPDTAAGFARYEQAQRQINDDAAGIGLYTQNTLIAVSDRLKDFWVEKSQGDPVFSDAYLAE
ncbi:MAG: ABC transporter substrate-binding protein [Gordonia sp. (in: high G+C Gram-positive bacteria)]|uniref:ABC transporter substrate-binding protein n=1 Tax=Gordonia sp. (in: high G+C Gram-positive bacteria) TaxID=84139 RepID=UPI0039E480D2